VATQPDGSQRIFQWPKHESPPAARKKSKEMPFISRKPEKPLRQDIRKKCFDATQKLFEDPYAFGFRMPIELPEYRAVIARPMDLTTIKRNLELGLYGKIEDWEKDVRLVWENAIAFNKVGIYKEAAEIMKTKFDGILEELNLTEEQRWLRRLVYLLRKLNGLAKEKEK
jgi:hypothetical protein